MSGKRAVAGSGRDGMRGTAGLLFGISCVFFVALSACSKPDPFERQPLKGFVTWKGQPIKYGTIVLEPADGQRAGAMASIRDGNFDIPRTAGPSPGKYSVWLHAYDKSGDEPVAGDDPRPPREILPAKYLAKPPAVLQIKRVQGEDANEFNFDLK